MTERKKPKTSPPSERSDKGKPAPKARHRPISANPGAALALVHRARRRS